MYSSGARWCDYSGETFLFGAKAGKGWNGKYQQYAPKNIGELCKCPGCGKEVKTRRFVGGGIRFGMLPRHKTPIHLN